MAFAVDPFARELVQHAPDAIVYADAQGIIRFWNKGAERIFGFAAAEALGQSLDIIIPERLRARHWEGYHEVMRTGRSRYGAGDLLSVPSVTKAGQRLSIEFTVLPMHDGEGRLAGIAAIMRDVTARFEEMKRLRQAAARAGAEAGRSGG
jgi:PAS domain S-box-containing protein